MNTGILYMVSTPIGNLGDITFRAVETLKIVEIIACEDTRKTGILCREYGIENKLMSYHDHNKELKEEYILSLLMDGKSVAVVSDAGTPGINDPGFNLVRAARRGGFTVLGIPGACAAVNALVISGLPTDKFYYEGFLPVKKGRETALNRISSLDCSIVLYESVHRIIKTLNDLKKKFSGRKVSVHREMTKIYEEAISGDFDEVIEKLEAGVVKGEFVIIISGISAKEKKKEKVNKYKKNVL